MKRAGFVMLVALCLASPSWAEERAIPQVRMTAPFQDRKHARRAYEQASPDKKIQGKSIPASWSDTGLRDDATLVFTDAYLDGGTIAYYFKDSDDRYFVFCQDSPLRYGQAKPTPPAKVQFFVGAPHAGEPGAMAVPLGSATDKFLIKILADAAAHQPPLPPPPQGKEWETIQRQLTQKVHWFTKDQQTKLRLGSSDMWVLQDETPNQLEQQTTAELVARLSSIINPLKKGAPCVVVVALMVNHQDDIIRLEGYKSPAHFCFSHLTKEPPSEPAETAFRLFFLPIESIQANSTGFSFEINSPTYTRPSAPDGVRFTNIASAGTGRMFK